MAVFGCASDQQLRDELSDFCFINSKLDELEELCIKPVGFFNNNLPICFTLELDFENNKGEIKSE